MGRQRKRSRVDGLQWLRKSLRRLWRWRLGRSVGELSRLGKSRRWRRLGRGRSQLRRRFPRRWGGGRSQLRRWFPRWWVRWPEVRPETPSAHETSADAQQET